MKHILEVIKKTVVFLGFIDDKGKIEAIATGFLVSVNNYSHLVTAKHVVIDPENNSFINRGLIAFSNTKDGKIRATSIDSLKDNIGLKWILHPNKDADVVMIPFPTNPQEDDVMVIPDSYFLTTDQFYEVYEIFFLSYQPGITIQRRISPIIRSGIISLMNDDNTFYIDAAAFPGNSGSPVFLKPSAFRYDDEGGISIGNDQLGGKFIGVVGSYIPYIDSAISTQTNRVRVTFEENTGLSHVWSVSFIRDIIESQDFKQQIERIPKHLV